MLHSFEEENKLYELHIKAEKYDSLKEKLFTAEVKLKIIQNLDTFYDNGSISSQAFRKQVRALLNDDKK